VEGLISLPGATSKLDWSNRAVIVVRSQPKTPGIIEYRGLAAPGDTAIAYFGFAHAAVLGIRGADGITRPVVRGKHVSTVRPINPGIAVEPRVLNPLAGAGGARSGGPVSPLGSGTLGGLGSAGISLSSAQAELLWDLGRQFADGVRLEVSGDGLHLTENPVVFIPLDVEQLLLIEVDIALVRKAHLACRFAAR
jgi:hypothetical protein